MATGASVSGFDVHASIANRPAAQSGVPPLFIFMTGDLPDPAVADRAGQNGGRLLQKPFRIAELVSLLAESLSSEVLLQPKNGSSD